MTYDSTDPRSALASATKPDASPTTGLVAEPSLGLFDRDPPQIEADGRKEWLLRGKNFVLAWAEAGPGCTLSRKGQRDEYALLLPDRGTRAEVNWQDESCTAEGPALVFIPAGDSTIVLPDGGRMTRLFTTDNSDLAALCSNARAYDVPRVHIPEFVPWPEPTSGWHLRSHSLDVPPEPGRFGRIFRCSTFMINALDPMFGPRERSKMSPHFHEDFEQCSLAVEGTFTHHLRWRWTTDMDDWRPDEHLEVGAPSAMVIPPPVIHTSQSTGTETNLLFDIFCPPRMDFSQKAGWVLNAEDYPMPETPDDRT